MAWCLSTRASVATVMSTHPYLSSCLWVTGIILYMCPANERRWYNVTSSLIGWAHTQIDPCKCIYLCVWYWWLLLNLNSCCRYRFLSSPVPSTLSLKKTKSVNETPAAITCGTSAAHTKGIKHKIIDCYTVPSMVAVRLSVGCDTWLVLQAVWSPS